MILWNFAKEFVQLFLPKEFLWHPRFAAFASKMSPRKQAVPLHSDDKNCAPEYHLVCGNFSGASLECFSEDKQSSVKFDTPYMVMKVDTRLKHQVIIEEYKGDRYTFAIYIADHPRYEGFLFPPTPVNE